MKTMLATLLATALVAGVAGQADAGNAKKRGYNASAPSYRSDRSVLRTPRGYRPARKNIRQYDYPRFGTERWWQLQEDMN